MYGHGMAIYAIEDREPTIHPDAFVHPDCTIIGDVRIGAKSSIWPSSVLRGDYGAIVVGEGTSIQDGVVLHATADLDTVVGSWCVVGHLAHLEGCSVADRSLIGVGSVVLHRASIGSGATIGAGAVVTAGTEVPDRGLAVGVPAVVRADRSDPELVKLMADFYVKNAARFKKGLRRLS